MIGPMLTDALYLIDALYWLAPHCYTAFLFTKSDIKTTVIPVTFFALAATPRLQLSNIPHAIFWIWLHLLQFDVSNQTMDPEEDELNKRYRPLPAKRITLRNAIILRWLLVPVCFALSACYSIETVYASIALVALTIIYDELGAHAENFVVRNLVNAAGFASFEVGATLVATTGHNNLDWPANLSVLLSAGIFATTIHAQDFKDVHGDKLIGRLTIPIVLPDVVARWSVILPLAIWSIGLTFCWDLDFVTAGVFFALAMLVGLRFLTRTSVRDDQVSFYWYNVWLSMAHTLPGYWRMFAAVPQ